ncbi:MAG: zinc-ribbon and DUF3426 domain-containing protein [Caldimonas sp.]
MSLATRCTSCGTSFRVVQDQLKVSEGWVRCGRCDAVFNALEGLFDLVRDAPTDWGEHAEGPAEIAAQSGGSTSRVAAEQDRTAQFEKTLRFPPAADPPPSAATPPSPRATATGDTEDEADSSGDDGDSTSDLGELLADPIDARLFGPRKRAEQAPKPAAELGGRDRVEFSDARFDSDLFSDNLPSEAEADLVVLPATDAGGLPLESEGRPEFIRRAERRARWQSRPARAALGVLALLAAATLVLQVAHHHRDTIAARWPSLRAPLVAWCGIARCRVEPPRSLEDVVVESSALTRAAAADAFLLSVTLRSRSATPLVTPSVDLTLTDARGKPVARRVLGPRDFNAADVLPPRAEAGLEVLLTAGPSAVVGYTVEIFYP